MSWVHLGDTRPKASKDYCCFVCGEVIPKGEVHTARRGIDEKPFTFRMHSECHDITLDWDQGDWECHGEGDCERPVNQRSNP